METTTFHPGDSSDAPTRAVPWTVAPPDKRGARYRIADPAVVTATIATIAMEARLSGNPVSGPIDRRGGECSAGRQRRDRRRGQDVAAAMRWVWSLSTLWVAAMNLHSLRQAVLPRRWKRLIARLNLIWPKTGSIVIWRWR
jgi:hypothetical protein